MNTRIAICVAGIVAALAVGLWLFRGPLATKHFVVTITPVVAETRLSLRQHTDIAVPAGRIELADLPPGEHTLEVKAPDHHPYKANVTVAAKGAGTATVSLNPIVGDVLFEAQRDTTVTATHADGRTFVFTMERPTADGPFLGRQQLPIGAYTFRLTHPVYQAVEKQGVVSGPTRYGPSKLSFQVVQTYENSLGMKFTSMEYLGKDSARNLLSIWETREQDYAAFVQATSHPWTSANAGPTHAAVNISWDDANAYCAWLTQKDQAAKMIPADQVYRLPTDYEWSCWAGLRDENPDALPSSKDKKVKNFYPWQGGWPPLAMRLGNYADKTAWEKNRTLNVLSTHTAIYEDGFAETSPVGSFPEKYPGICDLSGNVWEWVENLYAPASPARTARGGSFTSGGQDLLWSARIKANPDQRAPNLGFRVILTAGR